MKVYFVFEVKEEFVHLYLDNSRILFNILRNIYFLEREEVEFGYSLFRQITNPIDKLKIDRDIFLKYHQDIPYSKRGNVHYINNLYRGEVSRLIVKNSYIRVEVEQSKTSFFDILGQYSKNYFVCDFKNFDFFFLGYCDFGKISVYNQYNKVLV